jgi:hypothetical protein
VSHVVGPGCCSGMPVHPKNAIRQMAAPTGEGRVLDGWGGKINEVLLRRLECRGQVVG